MRALRKRWPQVLLVGCLVGGLVGALAALGQFDGLEASTLDLRSRHTPRRHPDPRVVILAIDEGSLGYFSAQGQEWPWPREFYQVLLRYLARAGARLVVFDMLFPGPDIDRCDGTAGTTDAGFAAALAETQRGVLATFVAKADPPPPTPVQFPEAHRVRVPKALVAGTFDTALGPLPVLRDGAVAVGFVNHAPDSDGVVRRMTLAADVSRRALPSLAVAAVLAAEKSQTIEATAPHRARVGKRDVALGRDDRLVLYWYGPGGVGGAFPYLSFAAAMQSAIAEERGEKPAVPPATWRDKIVIVGANAAGLHDFKTTPFTSAAPYAGMEIHATAVSNLLQGDAIRELPRIATFCITLILALLAAALFFAAPTALRGGVYVTGLGLGLVAAIAAAFALGDVWIEVVAPLTALVGALGLAALVSYGTEGRARREIKQLFGRYLGAEVVEQLLEHPESMQLGGREIEATVLFSDVKDFTSISESCKPQELVGFLNDYFSRATSVILASGAMLDKYIGDAIMGVFGSPIASATHARDACLAAIQMQKMQFRYRENSQQPVVEFITRIGINSGPMVVGNIGSPQRLDYTAIGDNVNLGARLEGVNKVFGTRILISETTAAASGDEFVLRELDVLRVKGRSQPVRIFELVGLRAEATPAQLADLADFAAALAHYRARRFAEAHTAFLALARRRPEDAATAVYVSRCQFMADAPPPDGWDGVTDLHTK